MIKEQFIKRVHDNNALRLYKPPETIPFTPQEWSDCAISGTTSTYAYALNLPQIGMCAPGRLQKVPLIDNTDRFTKKFSYEIFRNLLESDGAIHLHGNCVPQDSSHLIAIRFGQNFEFGQPGYLALRRDDNGLWSYKHSFGYQACGQIKSILNVDFEGHEITDPQKADFHGLNEFGGYFSLPYEGITFRPQITIPRDSIFEHIPVPN